MALWLVFFETSVKCLTCKQRKTLANQEKNQCCHDKISLTVVFFAKKYGIPSIAKCCNTCWNSPIGTRNAIVVGKCIFFVLVYHYNATIQLKCKNLGQASSCLVQFCSSFYFIFCSIFHGQIQINHVNYLLKKYFFYFHYHRLLTWDGKFWILKLFNLK